MNKRDQDNWTFWKRVAKILGGRLHGWSWRESAFFVDPKMEISGGAAIGKLVGEIDRLKALARHAINTAADTAATPIEEWAEAKLREVDNPDA